MALLAAGWFLRAPPVTDVTWKVVADRVEVRFRSASSEGISLEVAGGRQEGPRKLGEGSWSLRFQPLPLGQEERASLLFAGTEVAGSWVRGEAPALRLREVPLAPGPGLGVEVLRPCALTWGGPSGSPARSMPPGVQVLPLAGPGILDLPAVLEWSEVGEDFALRLDWGDLFERAWRQLEEELREVDVDASLRATAPRLAGSPIGAKLGTSFEEYRRPLRRLEDWIPALLARGELPLASRRRLFRLWQTWSRSVVQEVIQGIDEGEQPLEVPAGLPGALFQGRPDWRAGTSVLLTARHPTGIRNRFFALDNYLEGETDLLERRQTTKILDFRWPDRQPDPGEWTSLSIETRSLEQWSQLEVFHPEGDFRIFLWHPRPIPYLNNHDIDGWISVVFPADLGPPPGATMELRARSLLSPQIQNARIYQLRVGWSPPTASALKP